MIRLRLVISGGQTGADRTALEEAKRLGFQTGGTVPNGCRTEAGAAPELVTEFGCVEDRSAGYVPRTIENVRNAEATVWFGTVTSPGYYCTKNAAHRQGKPFYANPTALMFSYICSHYGVVNVAGNRRSKNPAVVDLVKRAFASIAQLCPAVSELPNTESATESPDGVPQ